MFDVSEETQRNRVCMKALIAYNDCLMSGHRLNAEFCSVVADLQLFEHRHPLVFPLVCLL